MPFPFTWLVYYLRGINWMSNKMRHKTAWIRQCPHYTDNEPLMQTWSILNYNIEVSCILIRALYSWTKFACVVKMGRYYFKHLSGFNSNKLIELRKNEKSVGVWPQTLKYLYRKGWSRCFTCLEKDKQESKWDGWVNSCAYWYHDLINTYEKYSEGYAITVNTDLLLITDIRGEWALTCLPFIFYIALFHAGTIILFRM